MQSRRSFLGAVGAVPATIAVSSMPHPSRPVSTHTGLDLEHWSPAARRVSQYAGIDLEVWSMCVLTCLDYRSGMLGSRGRYRVEMGDGLATGPMAIHCDHLATIAGFAANCLSGAYATLGTSVNEDDGQLIDYMIERGYIETYVDGEPATR